MLALDAATMRTAFKSAGKSRQEWRTVMGVSTWSADSVGVPNQVRIIDPVRRCGSGGGLQPHIRVSRSLGRCLHTYRERARLPGPI